MAGRTVWGFEFTIPVTFARYFRGDRPPPEVADPDDVEVTMTDDLRFEPETLRIQVGQTVVWRNTTPVMHTVTADPDQVRDPEQVSLPEGAEPFDSGFMFEGDVFRHTFTEPGEYVYVCVPHDMAPMVGRVVVDP
jgi:plastocyanin